MDLDGKGEPIRKVAVIVAGGKGTRMKSEIPKQFLLLDGKPLLYYSIKAFREAFEGIEIILVLPEEYLGMGQEILDGYFGHDGIRVCVGGRTRFHSVQNGLALAGDKEAIIFVHDGVRCLVPQDLLKRCLTECEKEGTAIPVIAASDSVRLLTTEGSQILNRDRVRLVQTPQTFHSKILLPAFQIDYKEGFTDEASVVESYGLSVHLVQGDPLNIKITSPIDLKMAEVILLEMSHNQG